jgi:monoamine oxidase
MARSKLFAQIQRAFREANFQSQNGWSADRFEEKLQSRRDFLKVSGLVMLPLAAGVPSRPLFSDLSRTPVSKKDPVLILGGGAAGLAAAYTLLKSGIPVQILEANNRIGGRIFTKQNFNLDKQFVELGAEYIDTDHETLIQLAKEMKLEVQDTSDDPAKVETELLYFGGKFRTHADLVAAIAPICAAVTAAKKEGAVPFSYRNATPSATKWDRLSLAEFLDSLRGRAEDWVLDAIGIGYTLEMGRDPADQSSVNLFGQIDDTVGDNFELFGPSDETKRVRGGNSLLTQKLSEAITKNGGLISLSTKVLSLKQVGQKIVAVTDMDGAIKEFSADQVICTLPFSVLRDVEGLEALGFSKVKLDCIRNIKYGQNSKLIMDFRTRPWNQKTGTGLGPSASILGDFASQNFWETSKGQQGKSGILTNFLGGNRGLIANRDMIRSTALPDLAKIFPGLPSEFNQGVAMNWNQMPMIRGSYVCVGAGEYTRFFGAQSEPEVNGKILFAGEHTSVEFMGFMNGAFETGIQAAQAIALARSLELTA